MILLSNRQSPFPTHQEQKQYHAIKARRKHGYCGGPLILLLYFLKGDKGVWISSFLQTAVSNKQKTTANRTVQNSKN
ncbi:conserved hypothetical protein [Ricinus communis]|uniref:Uncharacterized protein n=1 Tax=Ricinus communis TaxID=3988 RepID=B9S9D7_RICCO|nr:conserved hypothetical protein [Ricinus communis]